MVPARQTQRVIYSLKTSFQYGHKYHVVHSYKSGLVLEISAVQSFRVISSEFQIHTRGLSSSEIKQVSLSRRDQLQAEMCPYCSLGTNILADIRLRTICLSCFSLQSRTLVTAGAASVAKSFRIAFRWLTCFHNHQNGRLFEGPSKVWIINAFTHLKYLNQN